MTPSPSGFLLGLLLIWSPAVADELPLLGLAHVGIRVSDLDKARAFYHGIGGFEEAFDAKNPDGSVAAAYFKINDLQFIEVLPGLTPGQVVPMSHIAIRTDQINKLRQMIADRGLNPTEIALDPDGSLGFSISHLPGIILGDLEFVQYAPGSLADRTKGQFLGDHRTSTHLEHAGMPATDFDAAYHFYVTTLGFHERWRRVAPDRSRVTIDHILMPGPSGDFVELSNFSGASAPLTRGRAGTAAHFALEVPDVQVTMRTVLGLDSTLHRTPPHYGLDNRWAFNTFDPDGTRVEFMQPEDPAHPTPAVAITPADMHPNPDLPK